MNVYSNSFHTAMDFLSNKTLNISNLLSIERDFNIRNTKQDLSVSLHPITVQALRDLVDSYSFVCPILALSVLTHYLNIQGYANTVIDLILLDMSCTLVPHHIKPNLRQPSDHISLIVGLLIIPENICTCRIVLKYDSE